MNSLKLTLKRAGGGGGGGGARVIVLNDIFNIISVITWRSALLVKKTIDMPQVTTNVIT